MMNKKPSATGITRWMGTGAPMYMHWWPTPVHVDDMLHRVGLTQADYQVEINTPGTHASVETTVVMTDAEQNRVVATGTSPDIIVASVKAFVEGYNLLWARQRST